MRRKDLPDQPEKRRHLHDHRPGDRCDQNSTILQRSVLWIIAGGWFFALWCLRDSLPFPAEVLYLMLGAYFTSAFLCVCLPIVARICSPIIGIFIYIMVFGPFITIPLWNKHIPWLAGVLIGSVLSIPILCLVVAMLLRVFKMIAGIDVLAEDERIEAKARLQAEQMKKRYPMLDQRERDDDYHLTEHEHERHDQ